jgi:hypothetical protein
LADERAGIPSLEPGTALRGFKLARVCRIFYFEQLKNINREEEMKLRILAITTLILFSGSASTYAGDMFLFAKVGQFKLKDDTFNSDAGTFYLDPITIDTTSTQSSAIGMEWLLDDRWMAGFELYKMNHDWKSSTGIMGEMNSSLVVFSGKHLFMRGPLRPYIGAGLGLIYVDFNTGDSFDTEQGVGGHLGAGILFNFGKLAAYAEARYIDIISIGFSGFNFSGSGIYGGVRFQF